MAKIGFIGVGVMGRPMAGNIKKHGHEVVVFDMKQDVLEAMRAEGFGVAASPAAAAQGVDVVITMLPSSPHVKAVALGENGIIHGIKPGTVYIDMSTIDPTTSAEVAKAMAAKGIDMIDSPVAKGVLAARGGTLALYVGGKAEVLEKVRPILECMGTPMHMGGNGAGEVTKLTNNIILATIVAATSEMLVYGAKHGVDIDKLYAALAAGTANSHALTSHVKALGLTRKFDTFTFPAAFMMKDIDLCMQDAKAMGLPLFYPVLTNTVFAMLRAQGGGKSNYSDILTVFERFAGVEAVSAEAQK